MKATRIKQKRIEEISKSVANLKGILGPSRNAGPSTKAHTRPLIFGDATVQENEGVDNYTYHLGKSLNTLRTDRSKESVAPLENKLKSKKISRTRRIVVTDVLNSK